jgi:hypothetical protein
MEEKTCPGCKKRKAITEFNWKLKARGIRQVRCRDCTKEQSKDHYRRNREYYLKKARQRNEQVIQEQRQRILEYLATHPCVDCGEADVVFLEFDHVRGKKRGDIAHMLGDHAWSTIEAEIEKCEVRCAKCHRRKTAHTRGWYRGVEA